MASHHDRDDDNPSPTTDRHSQTAPPFDRPSYSRRGQIVRGIAAALACEAAVRVPWQLVRPLIRPDNIAAAVASLMLSTHMLVGYAGGRAAARAGLAHDDSRAQWIMAWIVTLLSYSIELAVQIVHPAVPRQEHPRPMPEAIAIAIGVALTVTALLVRFGFAMGTWAQARREGKVTDEDEAGVD